MNKSYKYSLRALVAAVVSLFAITPSAVAADAASLRPTPPPTAPSNFNSDLYRVSKTVVDASGQVSEEVTYKLRLEAVRDIDQARLLETLPAGLSYVSSQPAPTESRNGSYMWNFTNMAGGSSQEVLITVRPEDSGWFVTNTKVSVIPQVELPIFAGRAKLELTKTGPAQAELGDDVTFQLVVTNVGNAAANDVIVTDTLPAGLYGPDRSTNVVTHKLGTIAAGESRKILVPARASVKGEWDNQANVYIKHLVQANASAHISIVESKVTLTKSGQDRAFVFGQANYNINIRNDGDTVLRNIELTDEAPEGVKVASASHGGEVRRNEIYWVIPQLNPGESVVRTVDLIGMKQFTMTSTATVRLSTGRLAKAAVTTIWEGAPGVLTEIVDDVDPVKVGDKVVYTIKITNQSPMRGLVSDAIIDMAPNLNIVEVKGVKAIINGQRVKVENVSLKPGGSMTFKIIASPTAPGLSGVRFEFGNGYLPRPVVKEESTYVY